MATFGHPDSKWRQVFMHAQVFIRNQGIKTKVSGSITCKHNIIQDRSRVNIRRLWDRCSLLSCKWGLKCSFIPTSSKIGTYAVFVYLSNMST